MSSDLVKSSKSGMLSLMTGQVVRFSIQILSVVLMARLLSPKDYGLTAIVISVIALGEVVRDFGLSTSAIQADHLSADEKSNLFWMNSAIGLGLGLLLFSLASPIAHFYKDDRLVEIAQVLSLTFLINGLSTQYKAGLNREMKFKAIAMSDSLAAILSTTFGITSAFYGFAYWAIVVQYLSNYLLAFTFYILAYKWLPSLPSFSTDMRRFTRFGMHLMASQILGQLARSVDTLIIGQRFSTELLGFYNRAQQIVIMGLNQINTPSTTLAIPVLSKLKNDEVEYQKFLKFGQAILIHTVCLFFGLLAVNANLVVNILLGPKWLATIPLVQILCGGAMFQIANYSSSWIFISKGLTKEQLKFTLTSRPFVIAMIFIGSFWSMEFVAVGYSAGLLFLWIYCFYFLKKKNIKVDELFKSSIVICSTYITATYLSIFLSRYLGLNLIVDTFFKNLIYITVIMLSYAIFSRFKETFNLIFKLNFFHILKRK
jgi:polysaccharide transporter, PST family